MLACCGALQPPNGQKPSNESQPSVRGLVSLFVCVVTSVGVRSLLAAQHVTFRGLSVMNVFVRLSDLTSPPPEVQRDQLINATVHEGICVRKKEQSLQLHLAFHLAFPFITTVDKN